MSQADAKLSLRDVSVTYRTSRGPLDALGPMSIDVADGEFVAILGPSGCGKSTLLKIITGLLPPSGGDAVLNGAPITKPRQDVGIVFQQPTLLPWRNVLDNVLEPIRVQGKYSQEMHDKAIASLEMVGLEGFASHYPHELSGGMKQRVAIARGLIHDPQLLLMDEPFAALDALTREQMTIELQEIFERTKKSVVLITHSIPEAVFMADRVAVLSPRPGRIIHVEKIGLQRPRGLDTMALPEFTATCDRLRRLFTH
ncbi:MAG: ABC transporter ATP-binding protein [Xanthobacteraceae bacterium]|nr:ABC transporter ATP-binding protein [Xanthobacteraceae bacterium]MCW5674538.1 ABC transporter ATP-binding protein [Xanthobacteraceae bacterium]